MSKSSIDEMINSLSEDLEPVKPMGHPLLRVAPYLIGFALYVWLVVDIVGLRPDYAMKLAEPTFLFENAIMGLLGVTAALCASWLCVPDMRGQRWMTVMPFVFLGVFILWTVLRGMTEGVHMPGLHFDHCMEEGLWMVAIPAALMVYISTRGTTTKPLLSALMTIMSVSAFAYVGLRFTCMMDTIGHATIYHLIPFVVLGTVFGLLARRIFRW